MRNFFSSVATRPKVVRCVGFLCFSIFFATTLTSCAVFQNLETLEACEKEVNELRLELAVCRDGSRPEIIYD